LYRYETWALNVINKRKIEIAEMKFLWRVAAYIPPLTTNYLQICNIGGKINDRKNEWYNTFQE
jgi:hypothetical protein